MKHVRRSSWQGHAPVPCVNKMDFASIHEMDSISAQNGIVRNATPQFEGPDQDLDDPAHQTGGLILEGGDSHPDMHTAALNTCRLINSAPCGRVISQDALRSQADWVSHPVCGRPRISSVPKIKHARNSFFLLITRVISTPLTKRASPCQNWVSSPKFHPRYQIRGLRALRTT